MKKDKNNNEKDYSLKDNISEVFDGVSEFLSIEEEEKRKEEEFGIDNYHSKYRKIEREFVNFDKDRSLEDDYQI